MVINRLSYYGMGVDWGATEVELSRCAWLDSFVVGRRS